MSAPVILLTPVEAKNKALDLPVGRRITVVWRVQGDATIQTWKGTVYEKKDNWIVVTYEDGPPDTTIKYDLPYQDAGVEYISISSDSDPRSAGNMLSAIRARTSLFNITEWRPMT